MDFQESVKTCFTKYADFNGRASRPEFWWFYLFTIICTVVLGAISNIISTLFSFAIVLPTFAVTARRLHDINKSGWFQLWWMLGFFIGFIIIAVGVGAALSGSAMPFMAMMSVSAIIFLGLMAVSIYYLSKPGDAGDNQYGAPPAA